MIILPDIKAKKRNKIFEIKKTYIGKSKNVKIKKTL